MPSLTARACVCLISWGKDELCVCFFVEILKTNQPKISRHLAYLRRAAIAGVRRQGPWMQYRIVEPPEKNAARVLNDTLTWLANDQEIKGRSGVISKSMFCAANAHWY